MAGAVVVRELLDDVVPVNEVVAVEVGGSVVVEVWGSDSHA